MVTQWGKENDPRAAWKGPLPVCPCGGIYSNIPQHEWGMKKTALAMQPPPIWSWRRVRAGPLPLKASTSVPRLARTNLDVALVFIWVGEPREWKGSSVAR